MKREEELKQNEDKNKREKNTKGEGVKGEGEPRVMGMRRSSERRAGGGLG